LVAGLVNGHKFNAAGVQVIPTSAKTLMTNSGKYSHNAKGLSGRDVRFGSLAACAQAALTGHVSDQAPGWLN